MKLERKGQAVNVVGQVAAPSTFNIASSRIAFNILSSGLYNDKIRAVIRELACNAYDAHVAAGKKDVPFEIHLPTSFEPYFTIKDQGTGLRFAKGGCNSCHGKGGVRSEVEEGVVIPHTCPQCDGTGNYDAVKALYCTYFSSDKNDSNDFIGAMGLGSKSPFCYCEGFTIVNRYNGVTRIYSAFISEAGTPAVVLQDETETPDAPNGVEVTFPVQQDDCWEFENKAKVALEFFNPRPTLNIPIDINRPVYTIRTDTWGMRSTASTYQGNTLRAIQGNVQYAVGHIDESKMTPEQRRITQMPIDIYFPIGQLGVAASREALQLDETTRENILAMLDTIYEGMVEEIKKKVDACTHRWEAEVLLYSLSNQRGLGEIVKTARNAGAFCGQYKNFALAEKSPSINQLDVMHVHVSAFNTNWRASRYAKKEQVFLSGKQRLEALQLVSNGLATKDTYNTSFPIETSIAFVINDLKMGAEQYIHYFLQEAPDNRDVVNDEGELVTHKVKKVFLFSRMNKDVRLEDAIRESEQLMVTLGYPPVIRVSELKKRYESVLNARKIPSQSGPVREILLLKSGVVSAHSQGGYSVKGWTKAWEKATAIPTGKKFYIAVDNLAAVESGYTNAHGLTSLVENIRTAGCFGIDENTQIFGLKVGSKLRQNKKEWIDLIPYVLKKVKSVMTPAKQRELSLLVVPFAAVAELDENIFTKIADEQPLDTDSVLQQFSNDLKAARPKDMEASEALLYVAGVAQARRLYTPDETVVLDFNQRYQNEVAPVYPMIEMISTSSRYYGRNSSIIQKETKILLDYFRTCDIARRSTQLAMATVGN